MSELALTPGELDDYVRPRVERILVSRKGNTSVTLHIMSNTHWMEPECATHASGGWIDKAIDLYPKRYAPICSRCAKERFGVEVLDDE